MSKTRQGSVLLCSLLVASCVAYERDDSDAASLASRSRQRTGGTFTWAEAVRTSLAQNAELAALEAEARAAGAVSPSFDVELEFPTDTVMLSVIVDPLAVLGVGQRGAAIDVARAEAVAASERLALARWKTIAALAETFDVEASLAAIATPSIDVDTNAYERAGLASPVASAQLRAATARITAESAMLVAERTANRARARELLGLPASAAFAFAAGEVPPIEQPARADDAVLGRPDLAVAYAEFGVADAEFYRAVTEQYPSLRVGPDTPTRRGLGVLESLWQMRVPFATSGNAEAARLRRDAARERLLAAFLRADNEAAGADATLTAARAADEAAVTGLQAGLQALAVGQAALQVDEDAFDRVAEAAVMVAREAVERRAAALARVRAEIARAMAYGWPAERRSS